MKTFLATALFLTAAAPAFASERQFDFQGGYAGLSFGLLAGEASMTQHDRASDDADGVTFDGTAKGPEATLSAGYNFVLADRFLAGVEGGYTTGGREESGPGSWDGMELDGFDRGYKMGPQTQLRARTGMIFGDNLMFVSGGLTAAGATFDTYERGSETEKQEHRERLFGTTFGAGFERGLADDWSVRAEYQQTNFGEKTITPEIWDYDGNSDNAWDLTDHSLSLGVSKHF